MFTIFTDQLKVYAGAYQSEIGIATAKKLAHCDLYDLRYTVYELRYTTRGYLQITTDTV